jgi:hypothetical protein
MELFPHSHTTGQERDMETSLKRLYPHRKRVELSFCAHYTPGPEAGPFTSHSTFCSLYGRGDWLVLMDALNAICRLMYVSTFRNDYITIPLTVE